MAATNFTPISLYYSTTASAVPTSGNLVNGELALNTADMKLYAKNSSGVVTLLASNAATAAGVDSFSAGSTGFTPSTATTGAVTLAGTLNVANGGTGLTTLTANRIPYGNGTSAFQSSANLTFDGSTLTGTTVNVRLSNDYKLGFGDGTSWYSGNGSTGYLTFGTNNTERARFDVNGNLGIGTSSPSGKLTVANTYTNTSDATIVASATIPGINLRSASTGRFSIFTNYSAANSTSFVTGTGTNNPSVEAIAIEHTNNNIGFGSQPNTWFSTRKALQFGSGGSISASTNSSVAEFSNNVYIDAAGSNIYVTTGTASRYQQSVGSHVWYTAASGTGGTAASLTQVLNINTSGAIGVGSSASFGTSGQVLTSGGSGAAPTWATAGGGGFTTMVTYTSSTTWTVPAGITKVKVTVTGGGGGGGSSGNSRTGTGGAAGGTAIKYLTTTPGAVITVTIGAGGTSTGAAAGTAGGTSTFSTVSATGGTGGSGGSSNGDAASAQLGGIGSGGDVNLRGGRSTGGGFTYSSGVSQGTDGGNSIYGGAGGGCSAQQVIANDAGTDAGVGSGSGGGGGASSVNGGAGGSGRIVIEY
jgi:hypothetical protein